LSKKRGGSWVEGPSEHRSWAILARNFSEKSADFGQEGKKQGEEERNQAALNMPSASLRSESDESRKRRGNDAPWKAWKTQTLSFPLFPPGLDPDKLRRDPHFHRADDGSYPQRRRQEKMKPKPISR
jgi:hypothetical protein